VQDQLDTTLFPGIPSSVYAHSGFLNEQAQTATTILAETKRLISTKGATSVFLVRFSLSRARSCDTDKR
jgi:hypothetical protein